MQSNFKRNLFISSTISLLVLVVSSTASYISIKKLLESTFWVNHTQEVIYNLNQGEASIIDAQTSMRGFLITGDKAFINMYNQSVAESATYFTKLDSLTADNQVQQKALASLKVVRVKFFFFF